MHHSSALALARQVARGELTSSDLVRAQLARIRQLNPTLNAVVVLQEEQALQEAAACDQEAQRGALRGPLHGIPMTVKEQFWVRGTPSTLNTKLMRGWVAAEDSLTVTRLKKAGAIILGKTNVPLNLLDYQVWGDLYPEGKNPYSPDHTPGGSSGGSAAALASGMTPLELGGDFGGSVRVPAHFCGVYGLKPTENSVPIHGMGPTPAGLKGFVSHMAQAGPMARTPEDLELAWTIIRGPDVRDRSVPRIAWRDVSGRTLRDYRIAWVDGWPGYPAGAQTRAAVRRFVDILAQQGARVTEVSPTGDLHRRTLALYVRLFPQLIAQGVPGLFLPLMKHQIRSTLMKGFDAFQREYDQGFRPSFANYAETLTLRAAIVAEWERFLEPYDLLVCPASYGPAFRRCQIGTPLPAEGATMAYVTYAWPYVACFNASGHPAMSVPLGLGDDGLPLGVQLVGPYWSEPDLLQVARLAAPHAAGFVPPPMCA
jgi:amidase